MADIQQGQRVNRITVMIGDYKSTISLYRTNQKLGETTNEELGIPSFEDSGLDNKSLYMDYCRDFMTHLLQHGGVDGFYFEAKQEQDLDDATPRRFDNGTLSVTAQKCVNDTLANMTDGTQIEIVSCLSMNVDVGERYADQFIRFGDANVICNLKSNGKTITINVVVSVRSGQLCKPKMFTYDGSEYKFNITTIKSLLK